MKNTNKRTTKLFAILLSIIMMISLFSGCKKEKINTALAVENQYITGTVKSRRGRHDHNFYKETDRAFISEGKSKYLIVYPSDIPDRGKFALNELQFFIELATGVKIEAVSEKFDLDKDQRFISLGRTNLLERKGWSLSYDEYLKSGFNIKSDDDGNVYIFSSHINNNYNGVLCGVYEFLKHVINLEIFTEDIYTYDTKDKINMPKFDVEEIPDFDTREIGGLYLTTYNNRLRLLETGEKDTPYGMNGHCQVIVLKEFGSKAYENHPDWLSADKSVLCWSAFETGMHLEYIDAVVNLFMMNPENNFMVSSPPDFSSPCSCERCNGYKERYKTNNAGLQNIFINKVIDGVLEKLAVIDPDRYVTFGLYAYEGTKTPPVTYDEKKKEYVPHCEEVLPHERVQYCFAPIEANIRFPLDSEVNRDSYNNYKGWASICKDMKLFFYPYTSFSQTYSTPQFALTQNNARMLAQGPTTHYYEERISTSSPFADLYSYVESKLMWNCNYDFELLAKRYIENVYGDAAPAIVEYYDFYKVWATSGACDEVSTYATPRPRLFSEKMYPKAYLNVWDRCLEKAYNLLEQANYDRERYLLVKDRIDFLYFANNVNRVQTYYNEMNSEERAIRVNDLKGVYNSLKYKKQMSLGGSETWNSWFEEKLK